MLAPKDGKISLSVWIPQARDREEKKGSWLNATRCHATQHDVEERATLPLVAAT